jgi:hypothetical protein
MEEVSSTEKNPIGMVVRKKRTHEPLWIRNSLYMYGYRLSVATASPWWNRSNASKQTIGRLVYSLSPLHTHTHSSLRTNATVPLSTTTTLVSYSQAPPL